MFLSEWREFPSAHCLAKKKTWWQLASRCCWNLARPWHASELVSFLVGLRTYQHPDRIDMFMNYWIFLSPFGHSQYTHEHNSTPRKTGSHKKSISEKKLELFLYFQKTRSNYALILESLSLIVTCTKYLINPLMFFQILLRLLIIKPTGCINFPNLFLE